MIERTKPVDLEWPLSPLPKMVEGEGGRELGLGGGYQEMRGAGLKGMAELECQKRKGL